MSIKITQEGAAAFLAKELDQYDWFYDLRAEDERSITIYCNHIDKEIYSIIPDIYYDFNIKINFAAYLNCEEKYGIKISSNSIIKKFLSSENE